MLFLSKNLKYYKKSVQRKIKPVYFHTRGVFFFDFLNMLNLKNVLVLIIIIT